MGSIDLDPASCAMANETVRAERYYTQEDDGLKQSWGGCVWLNPPYGHEKGQSYQAIWTNNLIAEYDRGNVLQSITLLDSRTDTRWFHRLFERFPICFVKGRINFYTSVESPFTTHTHGTIFVYLGPHEDRFITEFSAFGRIARAIDTPSYRPQHAASLWEASV